jgi:hypothetical protein
MGVPADGRSGDSRDTMGDERGLEVVVDAEIR